MHRCKKTFLVILKYWKKNKKSSSINFFIRRFFYGRGKRKY
nr:MAG TPA: hypothetical protein [Caudoviricetes sp.]